VYAKEKLRNDYNNIMNDFILKKLLEHPNVNAHYAKRYVRFIETFSNNAGSIKHHILPKSVDAWPEFSSFKENEWNCSSLTLRQHFVAHWILWKAIGGLQTNAFYLMKHKDKQQLSSRVYESLFESIDHKYIQKQLEISNLKKYGVKSVQEIPAVRQKAKETTLARYGTTSPRLLGNGYENFKKTWNSEEFRNSDSFSSYMESRLGKNNGRAKTIVFRNKTYGCIKDCVDETGVSRYLILKEIKEHK